MTKPFYDPETYGARNSIGCLVRRLSNVMTPQAEALFEDEDLTFSHWIALMYLRDGFSNTCADLSRHMNHDSGATTRLIDQLEQRGLVNRNRSTSDRRIVHLALTKEGLTTAKSLSIRMVDHWNSALEEFSKSEASMLIEMLTRLVGRLENIGAAKRRSA